MTAVVSPGRAISEMSLRTGCSAPGKRNSTPRSSSSPWRRSSVTGFSGGVTLESVARTSWMRSAQTSARGSIITMNVAIMIDIRMYMR